MNKAKFELKKMQEEKKNQNAGSELGSKKKGDVEMRVGDELAQLEKQLNPEGNDSELNSANVSKNKNQIDYSNTIELETLRQSILCVSC
jgi:hypothetical protein